MPEAHFDVLKTFTEFKVNKETKLPRVESGISPSAEIIAEKIGTIASSGSSKKEIVQARNELTSTIKDRFLELDNNGIKGINNIDQLKIWVEANKGRPLSESELLAVQLLYDIKDGSALAMLSGLVNKDIDPKIITGVGNKSQAQIEGAMGIVPGELTGLGTEISIASIRDPDLLKEVEMLQVSAEVNDFSGGLREALNATRKLIRDKNTPDRMMTLGYLSSMEAQLEQAKSERSIPAPERDANGRMHYDYNTAGRLEMFPEGNHDQVMDVVKGALEEIEAHRADSDALALTTWTNWVEWIEANPMTPEDIRLEIGARLALHNTTLEMRRAWGHLETKGRDKTIPDAVAELKNKDRLLTREYLSYLMEGKENGINLPVGESWDMFQDAMCNYQELLNKVADFDGGPRIDRTEKPMLKSPYFPTRYANYFLESDIGVKKRVNAYMVSEAKKMGNYSDFEAKKAVELAEDLMWATGERSVANLAFDGGDKLAELIHFGELLSDDSPKGKSVGARLIRGHIETLTPGWLRFISKQKDPHQPIYHNKERGRNAVVYENAVGKQDWETYYAMIIPQKAQAVKNLLLSTDAIDPKKVGVTMFAEINDCFSKIDPYDEMTLRPWVYAVMLMNSTADSRTSWRPSDVWRMKRAALSTLSMTDEEVAFLDEMDQAAIRAGKTPERKRGIDSFMSGEQVDWAMKQSRAMGNVRTFSFLNDLEKTIYNIKL